MTKFPWPPPEYSAFLEHVGRIVFNFNTLEGGMNAIFAKLATDWSVPSLRERHWIVTTHIGNVTMCDAMRTIANELHEDRAISDDLHDLLLHTIKTFDLTREYRNWYIHGFNGIGTHGDQLRVGIHSFSSRNLALEHFEWASEEDIKWFADWCQEASHHIATAHYFIAYDLGYKIGGGPPPTLPGIWPLPSRLKKPSNRRLSRRLQPVSSQA